MLLYTIKRIFLTLPVAVGVSIVCFMLVHLAPGDPLTAILPSDASAQLQAQMRALYGFDKPLPVQYGLWVTRAMQGDLGMSIATGRPVIDEVLKATGNSLLVAAVATLIGFVGGCLLGILSGYFRNTWIDRVASFVSALGVSVPHYWLGMVLVIIFSVQLNWLPATGGGPSGSSSRSFDWDYIRFLILPAVTMSVIPMGIIARSVKALVGEILSQEFVQALAAKGLTERGVFRHVLKNAAPTTFAVMGLQLGYLLGGSILIETVFAWPGTGFLLNSAIFQRDVPLLQGTILLLAMFFVMLNLIVDVLQTAVDPRVKRS